MSPAFIAGLIILGFLLCVIEIFVPGGVIGITGTLLVVSAVIAATVTYGTEVGIPLGFACLAAGMVFFALWLRYFPRSRMGRLISLSTEAAREAGFTSQPSELLALIGKTGVALTELRPAGVATIEGRRIDVVTDGGFLDKGTPIRVEEVSGNRVVVRAQETA